MKSREKSWGSDLAGSERGLRRATEAGISRPRVAAAFLSDQAVCSAGNFLTSLMAARSLAPDQFGVFALLNIIVIFSLTVNNWLIRANLSKTAQVGDSEQVRGYVSTLCGLTLLGALIPALVLLIAASLLHHPDLYACLVLTAVTTQVQETMRRSAMAHSRFRVALVGDVISYLGQALVVAAGMLSHSVSISFMFWTIGITSLISAAVMAKWLQLRRPQNLREIAGTCWEQGRWITLSGLVLSPLVYGLPWIIEFTRGQVEAGVLSSLILVLGVCNPIVFSSNWLLLVTGQSVRNESVDSLLRTIAPNFVLVTLPLAAFWSVASLFPRWLLSLFYSNRPAYVDMSTGLRLVVACYAMAYLAVCLEVLTDTRDKSRNRVWIDGPVSLFLLLAGSALSAKTGLMGLLAVAIVAHGIRVVAYSLILARPVERAPQLLTGATTRSEKVSS